jgi:hypothetical protein
VIKYFLSKKGIREMQKRPEISNSSHLSHTVSVKMNCLSSIIHANSSHTSLTSTHTSRATLIRLFVKVWCLGCCFNVLLTKKYEIHMFFFKKNRKFELHMLSLLSSVGEKKRNFQVASTT